MAFSFLTQELAIDLGTANTVIFMNDNIVLDEPSIVAIDQHTGKPIAYGHKARLMHERTHPNIKTIRPLKDGVIADFNAAEQMIRGFVKMINNKRSFFTPSLKMVVCIPSGSTEVEIRAVRDSSEHAGGRDVYIIYEPMAAALGIGLDVEAPTGHMVVDIGGGTAEIAVISLGGIVCNKSIRVAGDEFNENICEYMKKQHNMIIGERTAEKVKMEVGSAVSELDNPPEDFATLGRDMLTGIPKEILVNYKEVAHALDKSIARIESAIMEALAETPPELAADIYKNGIYLAGGGSLLRGLDRRISAKTKLQVHVAEDPLRAVARGTSAALKNFNKFSFLIK